MSLYEYLQSQVAIRVDPLGTSSCANECPDTRCPVMFGSFALPVDILGEMTDWAKDKVRDRFLDRLKHIYDVAGGGVKAVGAAGDFKDYFEGMLNLTGFDIYTYVVYGGCDSEPCNCPKIRKRQLKGPYVYKVQCSPDNKRSKNRLGKFEWISGANNWERLAKDIGQCQAEGVQDFWRAMKQQYTTCPFLK